MIKGQQLKGRAQRGRPSLPPGEGKRHALGIRTTKQLKDQLAEASAVSGRSIAQEIEFRLEQSFDFEEHFDRRMQEAFGDDRQQAIFHTLSGLADLTIGENWHNWFYDPQVRGTVFCQWKKQLDSTHASLMQRDFYDQLIDQIRDAAKNNIILSRDLAIRHCGSFIASAAESVRKRYYDTVQEITGLSQADLDRAIDMRAAAERESTP